MKWQITGADRATGEEKTVTVEAHDERQAQLQAKAMNLLVAEMKQVSQVSDYQPMYEGKITPPEPPEEYAELYGAASSLGTVSSILSGIGWGCILLGLFGGVVIAISFANERVEFAPAALAAIISGSISGFISGLFLLFAGSLGRTVAAMGMRCGI
jgi:hypothetical protein